MKDFTLQFIIFLWYVVNFDKVRDDLEKMRSSHKVLENAPMKAYISVSIQPHGTTATLIMIPYPFTELKNGQIRGI